MNSKLNMIKNIGWAIGIVLCLLALFAALLVGAFTRYGGAKERDTLTLGAAPTPDPGAQIYVVGNNGEIPEREDGDLPETADGGQAYIDSLTFLCDSITIGLRDYGMVGAVQVWGSDSGSLPVGSLVNCTIRFPNDGSSVSPADAAMILKPERLVVAVGSDGLGQVEQDAFRAQYLSLVESIRQASPDTQILCLSICPPTAEYSGADGLSYALVGEANEWLRQLCRDNGLLFADAASAVRDSSGALMGEYASANGKTLNSAGMNALLTYLRTHTQW